MAALFITGSGRTFGGSEMAAGVAFAAVSMHNANHPALLCGAPPEYD